MDELMFNYATKEYVQARIAEAMAYAGSGGGSTPVLITKNITANGVYDAADDNADGFSSISIDVQPTEILDRTGKLSNILGTGSELVPFTNSLLYHKISAIVRFEFSGTLVVMPLMTASSNDIQGMAFYTDGTMANTRGVLIDWDIAGNVTAIALMGGQVQDLSSYASMIDANLKVYGTSPISYS